MIFRCLLFFATVLSSPAVYAQEAFTSTHGLHVTVVGWSANGMLAYTFRTQSPFKDRYDHGFIIVDLRKDVPLVHIEENGPKPLKLSTNAENLTKKWLKHYVITQDMGQQHTLPFTQRGRLFSVELETTADGSLIIVMKQDKKRKTVASNLPQGTQIMGVVQSPHEERVAIVLSSPLGKGYQVRVVGAHLNLGFS